METRIIHVDSEHPSLEAIAQAAELLKSGELVAFPTETVYGLGANALDINAVQNIYTAKGRPTQNPLIVHVATVKDAKALTTKWPKTAEILSEAFWPGPLTLVLPKKKAVPDETTAGAKTVAIRMPSHPVALALLKEVGLPIAAPSANTSGQLSPVSAAHVEKDLAGKIPMILDAGIVTGGIESTVIDLSGEKPVLLRPGLLPITDIERLIGPVERVIQVTDTPLPSPGLLTRHYAPRTPLIHGGDKEIQELIIQGKHIAWLYMTNTNIDHKDVFMVEMPSDHAQYAALLYDTLHALDDKHLDVIVVEMPPETDEWLGVRDRLKRAAVKGVLD